MYKYKIIIAYDGTNYGGWQRQPHTMSIQQKMEESLVPYLKLGIRLSGSGRTDAGVHALGQVAHFSYPEKIDQVRFIKSANGMLPDDLRILKIEQVPLDFHAQKSVKRKIYHYHLFLDPVMNPFRKLYALHIRRSFDIERCKHAASYFIGEHDFSSFANEPGTGCKKRNPVRTLNRLNIIEEEGGIRLEFESKGFLYKMVRNIVGALIEAGTCKIDPKTIPLIIEQKDRRRAGRTAPPQGLFLYEVKY